MNTWTLQEPVYLLAFMRTCADSANRVDSLYLVTLTDVKCVDKNNEMFANRVTQWDGSEGADGDRHRRPLPYCIRRKTKIRTACMKTQNARGHHFSFLCGCFDPPQTTTQPEKADYK